MKVLTGHTFHMNYSKQLMTTELFNELCGNETIKKESIIRFKQPFEGIESICCKSDYNSYTLIKQALISPEKESGMPSNKSDVLSSEQKCISELKYYLTQEDCVEEFIYDTTANNPLFYAVINNYSARLVYKLRGTYLDIQSKHDVYVHFSVISRDTKDLLELPETVIHEVISNANSN